jgi:hypothetical protein
MSISIPQDDGAMIRLASGVLLGAVLIVGCDDAAPGSQTSVRDDDAGIEQALGQSLAAARAGADSVLDALRPVPLMTGADEAALRRYGNDAHLARARALGVRPADDAERARLVGAGRLVPLADTSALYAHEVAADGALVVPAARVLVEEVGRRFQEALAARDLPAYRIIISSALRTAQDQAELRRTNANAAAGTSTHEFGTTVDILYESFAAPRDLPGRYVPEQPAALRPHLDQAARAMLEYAAARKSRELMAILGGVLRDMQSEGAVYVTLERQQPVYHITLAR